MDLDHILLDGVIFGADFEEGRGMVMSPDSGETLVTWDMGVISKVALHDRT